MNSLVGVIASDVPAPCVAETWHVRLLSPTSRAPGVKRSRAVAPQHNHAWRGPASAQTASLLESSGTARNHPPKAARTYLPGTPPQPGAPGRTQQGSQTSCASGCGAPPREGRQIAPPVPEEPSSTSASACPCGRALVEVLLQVLRQGAGDRFLPHSHLRDGAVWNDEVPGVLAAFDFAQVVCDHQIASGALEKVVGDLAQFIEILADLQFEPHQESVGGYLLDEPDGFGGRDQPVDPLFHIGPGLERTDHLRLEIQYGHRVQEGVIPLGQLLFEHGDEIFDGLDRDQLQLVDARPPQHRGLAAPAVDKRDMRAPADNFFRNQRAQPPCRLIRDIADGVQGGARRTGGNEDPLTAQGHGQPYVPATGNFRQNSRTSARKASR